MMVLLLALLHKKLFAPLQVNVLLSPEHRLVLLALICSVGEGSTQMLIVV
jgi:hypothetical protein